MDPLKKSGLKLFYRILKLHMKKLPTDMKNLGNTYLKEEFKLHRKANDNQYKEFLKQWEIYYKDIDSTDSFKNLGRDLSTEETSFLNEDQKKTLLELKKTAKKIA